MSVTSHERPGVYSTYTASSVVNGRSGGKAVGLAALHTGSTGGEVVRLTRWEEAAEAFGAEEEISELVRLLLLNGASSVAAAPVPDGDGYGDAFAALEKEEDVKVVVCDSADLTVQQALRDSVAAASKARRERIAVVGGGPEETVSQLTQRAAGLNSERVVLTAPALEGGSGAGVAAARSALTSGVGWITSLTMFSATTTGVPGTRWGANASMSARSTAIQPRVVWLAMGRPLL